MKLMVCGSRQKNLPRELISSEIMSLVNELEWKNENVVFIEGCCPDSADAVAEDVANKLNREIMHFPANSGNYLKRNIEMVEKCDMILAFWNGYSYGTAHAIAHGIIRKKPMRIIDL